MQAGRKSIALLWTAVMLLVALGVFAAVCRALHPADFGVRSESVRESILQSFGQTDPAAHRRPEELAAFDRSYGEHRLMTFLHVVPGGAFLLLAPLQFVRRLRNRHLAIHRWLGRTLIILGLVTVSSLHGAPRRNASSELYLSSG